MRLLDQWRETAREFDATFGPGAAAREAFQLLATCAIFAILLCLVAVIGEAL